MVGTLTALYLSSSYMIYESEMLTADKFLIEVAIIWVLPLDTTALCRFLLARVLFSAAVGKLSICGTSWLGAASIAVDSLNQPFPFTPVWHLAQLPGQMTHVISVLVFSSELLTSLLLTFTKSTGCLWVAISLTGFYAIIGNFNWVLLVMAACITRCLPDDIISLIVGQTTLERWGFIRTIKSDESQAEATTLMSLREGMLVSVLVWITVGALLSAPSIIERSFKSITFILAVLILVAALLRASGGVASRGFILLVSFLTSSVYRESVTAGMLPHADDFSGVPSCFVFPVGGLGKAVHSNDSRAGYLIQTKYAVMGTNTVGSDLGGTRYAELSLSGSVHGDETRPPFLLGHLPRHALKVWRIGTGTPHDVESGLRLLRTLERMVETGSNAVRVFFPGTADFVLDAIVGKKNQVQAFYQPYKVTSRVADHQWWKRNYDDVAALPTKDVVPYPVVRECDILVPQKVFGMTIDLILLSSIVCGAIVKLLFGTRNARSGTRKHK